jgi:predicted enzyme related to lactoylglutathione lyase
MFAGINTVSIPVTDLDQGRDFYGRVLGLGEPLYDLPESGWIEWSAGAPGGNLSITPAPAGWRAAATGVTVVLNVEDCEAAVEALRARGVPCEDAVRFVGYVTYATFTDPFGNRLQICSPA